ncbi:MAG: hypothetical protein LBS76_01650 [Mycoplasmataceae bacterium]|nr:hypothetical protein [Mycoplasmataceae bacterium]
MNYEMMKQSERELQAEFLKYCEHVYNIWLFVHKSLKTKHTTQKELEYVYSMEDISNHSEAQIQDDCIWSISKNEPLANHLRYLIAIINSSKDLERMSDYAVSAMRFFVNNKIPDDIRILIVNIMHDALSANAKVNQSLKTKAAIDTYKTCQTVYTHFRKQYDTMLDALSTILKKSTVEQIESLFRGAIIIIKHIERLMDHVVNIAENFMFIKQPDLFFTKQSKQVNK